MHAAGEIRKAERSSEYARSASQGRAAASATADAERLTASLRLRSYSWETVALKVSLSHTGYMEGESKRTRRGFLGDIGKVAGVVGAGAVLGGGAGFILGNEHKEEREEVDNKAAREEMIQNQDVALRYLGKEWGVQSRAKRRQYDDGQHSPFIHELHMRFRDGQNIVLHDISQIKFTPLTAGVSIPGELTKVAESIAPDTDSLEKEIQSESPDPSIRVVFTAAVRTPRGYVYSDRNSIVIEKPISGAVRMRIED